MPEAKRRPSFSVRLLAEGLMVVTSILLAFAIDAWWQSHKDRSAEQRILQELAGELRQNRARLDDMLAWHADTEKAATTALELAASDLPEVEPDSIDRLIGALSWPPGSIWIRGSLDAVLFSGDLALIENTDLRARIAAWPTSIERVAFWEQQEFKSHHEKWIPYLTREGYMPQISNGLLYVPGSREPWTEGVDVRVIPGGFDHTRLLGNREFQNLILLKLWDQIDLRTEYGTLGVELGKTLALIEAELER